jgi:hypothetical protein
MKRALLILMFIGGSSFLAHASCAAGEGLTILPTKCACTGVNFYLNVCQRDFNGTGCDTSGQQQTCGGSCTYISGVGCLSGGPKSKILAGSFVHRLQLPFNKTDKPAYLTCGYDNQAFETWLKETSSARRTKSL